MLSTTYESSGSSHCASSAAALMLVVICCLKIVAVIESSCSSVGRIHALGVCGRRFESYQLPFWSLHVTLSDKLLRTSYP